MGRPRKPVDLKVLHGDAGRRKPNTPVPFVGADIGPPHWLVSRTALTEWERVSEQLREAGRLAAVDQAALAIYCDSLATYAGAAGELDRNGRVVVGAHGGMAQNPWVAVQHSAYVRFVKLATEFGLTTAAREKLSPAAPPKDTKREKFFGS